MTTQTRFIRSVTGEGNLYSDKKTKVPVFYKIDIFQTFFISQDDEIPGTKSMEFSITPIDIEKKFPGLLPFLNGEQATVELNNGYELYIVPYKTTYNSGILAKLAAGNNEESLKSID